jgi:predicted DNA-binding transcriptional regulator AlpA
MSTISSSRPSTSPHGVPVYITPEQVAQLLQVSIKSVYRWAATDPTLPQLRLGVGKGCTLRFPAGRLERWLRSREGAWAERHLETRRTQRQKRVIYRMSRSRRPSHAPIRVPTEADHDHFSAGQLPRFGGGSLRSSSWHAQLLCHHRVAMPSLEFDENTVAGSTIVHARATYSRSERRASSASISSSNDSTAARPRRALLSPVPIPALSIVRNDRRLILGRSH